MRNPKPQGEAKLLEPFSMTVSSSPFTRQGLNQDLDLEGKIGWDLRVRHVLQELLNQPNIQYPH